MQFRDTDKPTKNGTEPDFKKIDIQIDTETDRGREIKILKGCITVTNTVVLSI